MAFAFTIRAGIAKGLQKTFPDAFASHFHQPDFRNFQDLGPVAVSLECQGERAPAGEEARRDPEHQRLEGDPDEQDAGDAEGRYPEVLECPCGEVLVIAERQCGSGGF